MYSRIIFKLKKPIYFQRRFFYETELEKKSFYAMLGRRLGVGIVVLSTLYITNRFARASFAVVPTGSIGYLSLYGKLSMKSYESGYHIINPFNDMVILPLTQQNNVISTTICSNEGLNIEMTFNIIYNLTKENCKDVYTKYGNNYYKIAIEPYLKSVVRDTISNYETKSLYNKETREQINDIIDKKIVCHLSKIGINVSNILINDIKLPKELIRSIENKLKAEQENEQMDFIIQTERKQINFSIEKENKEAERKIIEAEGIQKFQSIVTSGISDKLLSWKGIEATKDLVKSPNAKVIIIGNNKNGIPLMFNTNDK